MTAKKSTRELPPLAEKTQLILVVEDNPDDFRSIERVLRRTGLANRLKHCERGEDALAYLEASIGNNEAMPGMMLLDLGLPGIDGAEILRSVRGQDVYKQMPVIVITNTRDERDVEACRELGADSYIQKPIDAFGFMLALQHLDGFQFELRMLRE